jgi:nucleoside 2-deoxyribosyltransferase
MFQFRQFESRLNQSTPEIRVLLIGDVFIDFHADGAFPRPGGIFHAARGLKALRVPFAVGYARPSYLESAEEALEKLRPVASSLIATITGSPNVMVVADSMESGLQQYHDVLWAERAATFNAGALRDLVSSFMPTDVLAFPGGLVTAATLAIVASTDVPRIHVDTQYAPDPADLLVACGKALHTVFVSATSPYLRNATGPEAVFNTHAVHEHVVVIYKENRGGSRALAKDGARAEAGAYLGPTTHSVGVGDVFDVTWLAHQALPEKARLRSASWAAFRYASTNDDEIFESELSQDLAHLDVIADLAGLRLRWEDRPSMSIYIAAPDFPSVQTRAIDALALALQYHNFTAIRPVQIGGLADAMSPIAERRRMFSNDFTLLRNAAAVIAVPLTVDPGTFAEMGVAAQLGIPVILYDAVRRTDNLFVEELATRRTKTLPETIGALFELLGSVDA